MDQNLMLEIKLNENDIKVVDAALLEMKIKEARSTLASFENQKDNGKVDESGLYTFSFNLDSVNVILTGLGMLQLNVAIETYMSVRGQGDKQVQEAQAPKEPSDNQPEPTPQAVVAPQAEAVPAPQSVEA